MYHDNVDIMRIKSALIVVLIFMFSTTFIRLLIFIFTKNRDTSYSVCSNLTFAIWTSYMYNSFVCCIL